MTNTQDFSTLTPEQKQVFHETYRNHPLVDYIDWNAYFNSENGNAMDFVRYIDKYENEDGDTLLFVDRIVEDDLDYKLIFNCSDSCFYKEPDTDTEE